ncbi:hypothetical protein BSR56_13925 [Acinetobacter haemolyticus]|nr:hypothetical protein BSR56_13925 [Acinetobacter haemolyticus]
MYKTKILLLSIILLFQGACMQKKEPPYIPQEGEVVTWKQNNHLIVKAKLGERRKHIVNEHCPKCERDFYKPEREHYLGQFPIDYKPEKFSEISMVEAENLPLPYSDGQLEFNLMLNGSTVQATDSFHGSDSLDHPDQVKVRMRNPRFLGKNSKQIFETDLTLSLDRDLKTTQYGLDCYPDKERESVGCFSESKNKKVSGFRFFYSPDHSKRIYVYSTERIYGGIEIQWITDIKNINQAKNIDVAIWHLLDAWNVSPALLHK